jgi:hypothetical protein
MTTLPSDFLADHFRHSTGSIFVCSLPNERNGGTPAEICGRGGGARIDELVLHRWDKPDRGTFFCVNALKPKQKVRSKGTVHEIVCLHADLDFDKINMAVVEHNGHHEGLQAEPDAILHVLNTLEFPPSKIVHSGRGFHCYWLLSEALPASPELIVQVEIALRGLATMLGGDPACCEIARLLRLPGSRNTKNGAKIPVRVIVDSSRRRYELDELREWIAETRPLIARKGETKGLSSNPFLAAVIPGGGPSVDVEGRLAAMTFQGTHDTAIHQTQISVSAALLSRNTPAGDVIDTILEATRKAAGADGERWDWQRERREIERMCRDWQRKRLNGGTEPSSSKLKAVTMEAIGAKQYRPVEFLIPGIVPTEGVCLVCGRPKDYKSFLLFDVCISAALGRELLGGRKSKQGGSLYLALEDSERRLRQRGERLLEHHLGGWPANMSVVTECNRTDAGGLSQIRDWVLATRAAGGNVIVICIDVLMMVRPQGRDKQQAYQRDYEAIQHLRALAQELELAIIIAHHTRKSAADDAQDTISGTLGLAAAADCNIVIARQADGNFVFDIRGRDVEAQQLAAVFDKATLRWNVTGDAAELRQSETRRAILEALRGDPDGMTPAEVAAATDLRPGSVRIALMRMRAAGEVTRVRGKYTVTP